MQAREQYRSAAAGASTFYFVVADLALISPMYQTSLSYFITMFAHCIDASDKAPDVTARLRLLTTFATRFIFDKMQRGLFEQHKLLFSFMLATATARASGQVTQVCPYWGTQLVNLSCIACAVSLVSQAMWPGLHRSPV